MRLSRLIGRIAVIVLLVAAVSVTGVRTAQAEALVVPQDGYGFSVGGPMIRNHCGRHFPVQNVAKATYREILERRAQENGVDFAEGVATAITPLAFLETVMVKSYETLVDSDTKVDVNTGIVAAGRLQSVIDSRDFDHELLVMKVQMAAICAAVKSTVPQSMWGEIIEKLDEAEQHSEVLDVEEGAFDDDDEPFDPTEFIDEDDEF